MASRSRPQRDPSLSVVRTVSFKVTGGVAPYSWAISYTSSVSDGKLDYSNGPSALFTAPSTATMATITVTDSLNYAASAEITVGTSTAPGTASSCSGTFNWVTGSTTQTLRLVEDTSTSTILGYFGSANTSVSGTCSSTGLSFAVLGSPSLTFTGTFYTNSSSQEIVLGTYNGQTSYLSPQ